MSDKPAWFAAKRYGYGAGLPIAAPGWCLLIGYVAALIGLATELGRSRPFLFTLSALLLTGAFAAIAKQRTRGGWHWRAGGGD